MDYFCPLVQLIQIKELIKNAQYMEESPSIEAHHEGEYFYYLTSKVNLPEGARLCVVTIREDEQRKLYYHNHHVYTVQEYLQMKNKMKQKIKDTLSALGVRNLQRGPVSEQGIFFDDILSNSGYFGKEQMYDYPQNINKYPQPVEEFNQSAWHGSPYDFDTFDLGAVGSGSGANFYGWGLYFAASREISENYYYGLSRANSKITISRKRLFGLKDTTIEFSG